MEQRAELRNKINLRVGLREIQFCRLQTLFIIVHYDQVLIYEAETASPIRAIKLSSSPRFVCLSPCGRYIAIHETSDIINLYLTSSADKIQRIVGAPFNLKAIKFSGNSQKLIYGSSQLLCIWNIRMNLIEMRTETWRNINCFDMNKEGKQFALGNYNGNIYVLDFIERGRCNQIELKKHKNCVSCICFHQNALISISHDMHLLITHLQSNLKGQKVVRYLDMHLKFIPKAIKSAGDKFYFIDSKGMTWLTKDNSLVGFTDGKSYDVIQNEDGELVFLKYNRSEIEWLDGQMFRAPSESNKKERVVYKIRRS